MNILDINDLPTITMQISGREGTASGAWIINQEKKQTLELSAGNVNYTAGEQAILILDDGPFISSIESNTTLSIIIFNGNIPLYRDIVKFRGELNSVDFYSQYDHSADYYVYESEDDSEGLGDGTVDAGTGDTGGGGTGDTGGGDTGGGTGDVVISDFAIKFDRDNNGQGEMRSNGIDRYVETTGNVNMGGDFKVRTLEYGEFEATPVSLEEVLVFDYDFDRNNGNPTGWHPTLEANTPELEGPYYHFAAGYDQQASETLIDLMINDELSIVNIEDASVFKEDTIADWTVGMSLYKDATGTPIMDGRASYWDRYHFITKNAAGDWTMIRSTDSIVTHVEVVKDTTYLKFVEMFSVGVVTSPYIARPTDWADFLLWFDNQLNLPNPDVRWDDSRTSAISITRHVYDFSDSQLISVGDDLIRRAYGHNTQISFPTNLTGIQLDPESEGTTYQYSTQASTRDGVNFLLTRVDMVTGQYTNYEWYTVT